MIHLQLEPLRETGRGTRRVTPATRGGGASQGAGCTWASSSSSPLAVVCLGGGFCGAVGQQVDTLSSGLGSTLKILPATEPLSDRRRTSDDPPSSCFYCDRAVLLLWWKNKRGQRRRSVVGPPSAPKTTLVFYGRSGTTTPSGCDRTSDSKSVCFNRKFWTTENAILD